MNFKEFESPEKLRGGYYTPCDLATFLVRWVETKSPSRVLEPSCGDGVFLDALGSRNFAEPVLGFELDEIEAKKAAGYFTEGDVKDEGELQEVQGRKLEE